jgi:rubredoxin
MKQMKCTLCGYVHAGSEPPPKCPVCGADKSKFSAVTEPSHTEAAAASSVMDSGHKPQWRCTVCGYVHQGDQPPQKCPTCGADKSKFVELSDPPQHVSASSPTPPINARSKTSKPARPQNAWFRYPQVLTRLHGHPVTVHIPNGVLPVSVLFMLLSIWFESSSLAAAAKYNLFFVTLAMPAVIVTGLGDWINRYGGRMTKVFSTKMICAGIVTVMCITLSIWWLAQPGIYIGGAVRLGTFVIFHMIALVAAIVAGWYGGKLVFPKK